MTLTAAHNYPMVRASGSFLVIVGLGLVLASIWHGDEPVNFRVLGISALIGLVAIPVVRLAFPLGRPKAIHIVSMFGSIALEFLLFRLVFSHLPAGTTTQLRWLWALLLVGLHFLPMGFALGRRVVLLGVAGTVLAGSALLLPSIPFTLVLVVDGLLKAGFGASMALTAWKRTP